MPIVLLCSSRLFPVHAQHLISAAMAMAAAAQAEIQSFFASRHGQRTLIAASQRKLCDYFIAKNVTLSELPTVKTPERLVRCQHPRSLCTLGDGSAT